MRYWYGLNSSKKSEKDMGMLPTMRSLREEGMWEK
jgi:hypothetical protein